MSIQYEAPTVVDYGGFESLTAGQPPGGPEDCAEKGCGPTQHPGHSPPPGPPGGVGLLP